MRECCSSTRCSLKASPNCSHVAFRPRSSSTDGVGTKLKIAFADRAAATADPDFVAVPVEKLTSKDYADARRVHEIDDRRIDEGHHFVGVGGEQVS